jgi:hypothetical protein
MSEGLNIFHWAPKELSQDAFICWMLCWADPAANDVDPGLHQGGLLFLDALLDLHDEPSAAGMSVVVHRQVHHTDIIALIGENRFL